MKKIGYLFILIGAMACTTKHSFTPEERKLIGKSAEAGPMRVLKTDDPADSLRLRQTSEPLTVEDLRSDVYAVLKARMLATVNDEENRGVGIAAPQVGVLRQVIAIMRFDEEEEPFFVFYANPRIENYSAKTAVGREGCLSIPDRAEHVKRSQSVKLSYLDETTGERMVELITGFSAVICQHEVDHLNGILFIDRIEEVDETPVGAPED